MKYKFPPSDPELNDTDKEIIKGRKKIKKLFPKCILRYESESKYITIRTPTGQMVWCGKDDEQFEVGDIIHNINMNLASIILSNLFFGE